MAYSGPMAAKPANRAMWTSGGLSGRCPSLCPVSVHGPLWFVDVEPCHWSTHVSRRTSRRLTASGAIRKSSSAFPDLELFSIRKQFSRSLSLFRSIALHCTQREVRHFAVLIFRCFILESVHVECQVPLGHP